MRERVTEHRILEAPLVVRRREGEKGRLAAGELVDRRRRHGYPTLCSAMTCQKRPARLRVVASPLARAEARIASGLCTNTWNPRRVARSTRLPIARHILVHHVAFGKLSTSTRWVWAEAAAVSLGMSG